MAWNGSNSGRESVKPAVERRPPKASRGLWAGVIVVLLAVVAVVIVFGTRNEPKPVAVKESTKRKIADSSVHVVKPKRVERETREEPPTKEVKEKYPGETIVEVQTNAGYVTEITVNADGRRTRHTLSTSPWEFSSDGLLAMVLAAPPGQELPPLPMIGKEMDEEFRRSLKTPIKILPTDSEEVAAMKRIVMSAREEMKEWLDSGRHFSDILVDHRELVNENSKIRTDAIRELNEMIKAGDEEGARKYVTGMNEAFSQIGIEPIGSGDGSEKQLNKRQKRRLRYEKTDGAGGGGPGGVGGSVGR